MCCHLGNIVENNNFLSGQRFRQSRSGSPTVEVEDSVIGWDGCCTFAFASVRKSHTVYVFFRVRKAREQVKFAQGVPLHFTFYFSLWQILRLLWLCCSYIGAVSSDTSEVSHSVTCKTHFRYQARVVAMREMERRLKSSSQQFTLAVLCCE